MRKYLSFALLRAAFYLAMRPFKTRRQKNRENELYKLLGCSSTRNDPKTDQEVFKIIGQLKIRNDYLIVSYLEKYFKTFLTNCADLTNLYKLINSLESNSKRKVLKTILDQAATKLNEDELARLYVSGPEEENDYYYSKLYRQQTRELIKHGLKEKDRTVFSSAIHKKIEALTMSLGVSKIKERLRLVSIQAEFCADFLV